MVHNAGSSVVLTGGTLVLNSNGSYSFTPNANWNGAVPRCHSDPETITPRQHRCGQ
ncbi:cadherin-like domain-containing protein [Shewanella sp. ZOR0012]|nr:cadherin-like domain-containing protein [Shewanella sp. ZOR0012]